MNHILLAGTREPHVFSNVGGLYRSTDRGATFTLNGSIPAGPCTSLASNISNPALIYAAITSSTAPQTAGIYASSDTGATWNSTPLFGAAQSGGLISPTASQKMIKIATGPNGSIAALIIDINLDQLVGAFLSKDSGSTWYQFDLTEMIQGGGFNSQSIINSALIIDPADVNTIYVSGTATPYGSAYNAPLWSLRLSNNTTIATNCSIGKDGSAVHADSRSLAFDSQGRLLLTSDGGIFRKTSPGTSGNWHGIGNNLSLFENYRAAYDANQNLVLVAAQDNDTAVQAFPDQPLFNSLIKSGDGINVAVNDQGSQSIYYASVQDMGAISRFTPGNPNGIYLNLEGADSNDWWFFSPLVLNNIDPTLMAFGGIQNAFIAQDTDFQSGTLALTRLSPPDGNYLYTMDYGTQDNIGALLIGESGILLSTTPTPGPGSLQRLPNYPGGEPDSVVFDRRTQNHFYATAAANLWSSTDTGATFTNLTANLPSTFTVPSGLAFLSNNGVNALFIGGRNNTATPLSPFVVAECDNLGNLSNWRIFGKGLPNCPAARISYNPKSDTLLVGTFGRGSWLMYDVTSNFSSATVLQFGLANNDSLPDASILTGNRPLFKYGKGTLTIEGNCTYTGLSTVIAGRMIVNGIIPGDVLVNTGTILSGTGTIGGTATIQNGAILSPGNSIGTITIGNLNLQAGSITNIELDPFSASKIIVTNAASLGGNVQVTQNPGNYARTGSYDILTAGSIVGSFEPIVLGGLPGFYFTLLQYPNLVQLLYRHMISTTGLTGNAKIIADYLNNEDINSVVLNLLAPLTGDTLKNALNTISPVRNALGTFVLDNLMFSFSDLLDNHFSSMFGKECAPGTYTLWVNGFANFARQRAQNQTPAFHFDSEGALIGGDYIGEENQLFGLAVGYGKNHIHQKDCFGRSNINSYVLGGYGMTCLQNDIYLEYGVFGTINPIKNTRHIFFPKFRATASSSYNSYQLMPHFGIAYDIGPLLCVAERFLIPFVKFDWAINWVESFKEHGAFPFNMHQNHSSSSALRSELGIQLYQNLEKPWGTFILKETAAYVNKALFDVGKVRASLVGIDPSFTVKTLKENQNIFNCGIDLLFERDDGIFGSIEYDGEFGSGYNANNVQLKFGKYF